MILKAPFPYFGGKSRAAALLWPRFGAVRNYVEPFFGSGAMLLARPEGWTGTETVNDADGLLCNFWRALRANPAAVAQHADWPVNENDLHARHAWLVGHRDSLQARLEGDPKYFDAKIAGWWVWGMACWIGSGFCSGNGPWAVRKVDGTRQLVRLAGPQPKAGESGHGVNRQLVHLGESGRGVNRQLVHLGESGRGVNRQLVHLGESGRGVNRQLVHLGESGRGVNRKLVHLGESGRGVNRQLVHLGESGRGVNRKLVHLGESGRGVNRKLVHLGESGRGVNRKLVHLGDAGRGVNRQLPAIIARDGRGVTGHTACLLEWFEALSDRLARVRVCCGDWSRVCTPTPTVKQGLTAVFLDPPYADTAAREPNLYRIDNDSIAHAVRKWALERGDDPRMRIALCGYEGEHKMPRDWTCVPWKANGGYGSQAAGRGLANSHRERIWFSPHCLKPVASVESRSVARKVALCG